MLRLSGLVGRSVSGQCVKTFSLICHLKEALRTLLPPTNLGLNRLHFPEIKGRPRHIPTLSRGFSDLRKRCKLLAFCVLLFAVQPSRLFK